METFDASHLSMNQFHDAFGQLKVGESLVYFTGDLAAARFKAKRLSHPNFAELSGVAGFAWRNYEADLACLTQRRVGFERFDYIATKCDPVRARQRDQSRQREHA